MFTEEDMFLPRSLFLPLCTIVSHIFNKKIKGFTLSKHLYVPMYTNNSINNVLLSKLIFW